MLRNWFPKLVLGFIPVIAMRHIEFGSERISRSLLRGKLANTELYYSLRIEDSPRLAAESFNKNQYGCFKSFKKNELKVDLECVCRIKEAHLLRAFFK